MILLEVYNEIANATFLNVDNEEHKRKMRSAINYVIRDVFSRAQSFWWAIKEMTFTTISGVSTYYLPSQVGEVVSLRITDELNEIRMEDFHRVVGESDGTGKPHSWVRLGICGVSAQPDEQTALNLVSDNPSDFGDVSIKGISDDNLITETISLNGLNAVTTDYAYSEVFSVSKEETLGKVTVKAGTKKILELEASENVREYLKIRLFPTPDRGYDVLATYELKGDKLLGDTDNAIIPERFANVIIAGAIAHILMKEGDAKASLWNGLYREALGNLVIGARSGSNDENLFLPGVIRMGM